METSEVRLANVVFEDRLFLRRLERTLNAELERTNRLLVEQIQLLEDRKELLAEVLKAVEQRWQTEEPSEPIKPANHREEENCDD